MSSPVEGGHTYERFPDNTVEELYSKGFLVVRDFLSPERLARLAAERIGPYSLPRPKSLRWKTRTYTHTPTFDDDYITQLRIKHSWTLMSLTQSRIQKLGRDADDETLATWGQGKRKVGDGNNYLGIIGNKLKPKAGVRLHNDNDRIQGLLAIFGIDGIARMKIHPGPCNEAAGQPDFPRYTEDIRPGDAVLLACNNPDQDEAFQFPAHEVVNIGETDRRSLVVACFNA